MKFHHIGIATKNIETTQEWIKQHFIIKKNSSIIFDKNQNSHLMMIETENINIELVSGPMVDKLVQKRITYYHICYEVENINDSIKNFKNSMVISPPKEAILFDNRKVAFLMTPIGLIELLEE